MEKRSSFSIVIQAGGEARRMGTPKALVHFCGLPLICRAIKSLSPIASELIITANEKDSLSFLQSESILTHVSSNVSSFKLHSDVLPIRGALSGLYTALYHATAPFVGIVACDMVFPSVQLFLAELQALADTEADLAVPHTSYGYEPFHAVYRRETCLPLVKAALDAGEIRANGWYSQACMIEFSEEVLRGIEGTENAFVNVNTPEQLELLEQQLLAGELSF